MRAVRSTRVPFGLGPQDSSSGVPHRRDAAAGLADLPSRHEHPAALLAAFDDRQCREPEGDGLIVVGAGVVVEPYYAWARLAQLYGGEFRQQVGVVGQAHAPVAEQGVQGRGEPSDRGRRERPLLDAHAGRTETLREPDALRRVKPDVRGVLGSRGGPHEFLDGGQPDGLAA